MMKTPEPNGDRLKLLRRVVLQLAIESWCQVRVDLAKCLEYVQPYTVTLRDIMKALGCLAAGVGIKINSTGVGRIRTARTDKMV